MLEINNTPQFAIWATSLAFFFENLAHHEIFSHKLATFVIQRILSFVDKWHEIIAINLWHNSKFCIQTILETPWKSEARCIARIHLVLPTTYVPWLAYTSLGQFFVYSQKIIKIWHYVFHKKNHDNFLELLCDNSLRIIIFNLLILLGLCQWNIIFARYFYNPTFMRGWRWATQRRGISFRWCVW